MHKFRYYQIAFVAFLSVSALTAMLVLAYASWSFRAAASDRDHSDLSSTILFVEEHIRPYLDGSPAVLDSVCKAAPIAHWCRVTIVDSLGAVLADSRDNPAWMENHKARPEIADALAGDTGWAERVSGTLGERYLYLACPVVRSGTVVKAFRISRHVKNIAEAGAPLFARTALAGLSVLLLAIAAAFWFSRMLSRPVVKLTDIARSIARGDFSARMPQARSREMADLAESMSHMASQLDDRIRMVTRQKNDLAALLSSMTEGLIAVDLQGRLIMVNRAAGDMLLRNPEDMCGRPVVEVIRNTRMQEFIRELSSSTVSIEREIEFSVEGRSDCIIELHGSALRDDAGAISGCLVVFHDVTRMRRLENLRRDFVANVSHELRTPLTSIKGFVETLLDGAGDDPADRLRFLTIIRSHAERLNAIIEDLLTLSHLEQQETATADDLVYESAGIGAMVDEVMLVCGERAARKHMTLVCADFADTAVSVVPSLFEQALINIVDNAIKYSPEHTEIRISVAFSEAAVHIAVADEGPGIPPEHLGRIFERFYRIDKARSRKIGGTGLGLAIVKHIMKVLEGSVSVDSAPGRGSVFTLSIPAAPGASPNT